MRIGYDGKRVVSNMTGLGNYSRLVVESVGREYPGHELVVYTPRLRENPRLKGIETLRNVEWRLPRKGEAPFGKSVWRSRGIGKALKGDGVDVYHGLSNELPLNISRSGVRSVVTVHDVIYRRLPWCYKRIDRMLYDFKYGASCRAADRIIAISECTARDIVDCYGVDRDKIEVVYQGCDETFKRDVSAEEVAEVRRRYGLPERMVVQVGSIERRKNAVLTVRGMRGVAKDVGLVLVGRATDYVKEVMAAAREAGVEDRVQIVSNVSFRDLPAVYRAAECVAYPSRYEGFGLPVLEAATCGVPVVAATGSCLEEAGGEGSIYVNPDDSAAMAEALGAITAGEIDTAAMVEAGLRHAARFDNSNVARRIMEVYESVLR